MAISSYGAVSCLSVVEGSLINYFSVRRAYFMVASAWLGFDSAQPPGFAPSAFIYIISRRSRGFAQIDS
jgi:hypothetical protein